MMNFGENVKFYRKLAGMTQAQLAEAVNVSIETIKQIEQGRIYTGLENFAKISEALNVPADYLLLEFGRHCKQTSLIKMMEELSEINESKLDEFISLAKKLQILKKETEDSPA